MPRLFRREICAKKLEVWGGFFLKLVNNGSIVLVMLIKLWSVLRVCFLIVLEKPVYRFSAADRMRASYSAQDLTCACGSHMNFFLLSIGRNVTSNLAIWLNSDLITAKKWQCLIDLISMIVSKLLQTFGCSHWINCYLIKNSNIKIDLAKFTVVTRVMDKYK